MRHKLALTLALASFAVLTALGVGMAGADPLTGTAASQPATTIPSPTVIPSPQTPACSNGVDDDGDGLADMADPSCSSPLGSSEAPAPGAPTAGSSVGAPVGTGGNVVVGGLHTGTTINGNSAKNNGGGSLGVSHNQTIGQPSGTGRGNGGVSFPSATGGVQPQTGGTKSAPSFGNGGSPTPSNPTTTIATLGPAPIGVPNFVINSFEIPPFLLPIYQACGTQYGIPWQVLAAINKIETAFGTNLNVSSAGAVGWMQFLPSTWATYGVDANGDGRKDPYNPVDAICAAANYLHAAGGSHNLYKAILAYNHADWYAQEVLLYAKAYGSLPQNLVGSLTGLTQGHFPVAANARYADELSAKVALRSAAPGTRKAYGNAARVIGSSPTRHGIDIFSHEGAPVVAVNDGVIRAIGQSKRLGNFIVLEDVFGNRFTYAQLGQIVRTHHAIVTSSGQTRPAPIDTQNLRPRLYALPNRPDNRGRARLRYHPSAPTVVNPGRLQVGSRVLAGAVIARVAGSGGGIDPHINFAIRPVGRGAPQIDPKPILDGWKLLEATAIYRAAGKNPFARNLGVSAILLLSKGGLQQRVLHDRRLSIFPSCDRHDIATGRVDRRVLGMLEYLVAKGFRLKITSLKCGHGDHTVSGSVSGNRTGDAVDIASIDGVPVKGHQGPGTLTDALIKSVQQLQGTMRPQQVTSRPDFPGATGSALPGNADHIHIGYLSAYDTGYVNPFLNAVQGRIDQGVDFTGTGPIDAIGDAKVLGTGAPGWPGGGGVLYQLLDGPRAGQVIYVYEGVRATVRPGQRVSAGQQIATFVVGGSIEIGFADSAGVPLSHAVYHEGDVTLWGRRMASFLISVGAPGTLSTGFSQLGPGQWNRLMKRIGSIQNPTVPASPSRYSLPATPAAPSPGQATRKRSGGN